MRESQIQDRRKTVTLWTPVVIGKGFTRTFKATKKEYSAHRQMHHMRIPNSCASIEGALIIDLPQSDIRNKLDELIEVANFESDQVLIEYLRGLYLSIKEAKENRKRQGINQSSAIDLTQGLAPSQQNPKVLSDLYRSMDAILNNNRDSLESEMRELLNEKPRRKRVQKRQDKERRVKELYFKEKVKPKQIA